jgi:hypothetical protein
MSANPSECLFKIKISSSGNFKKHLSAKKETQPNLKKLSLDDF